MDVDRTPTLPAIRRGPGRPALGRDTPLTLDPILDAAERIIHAEGLEGLNMRRLAADLGVTSRALYNHVPSKRDLLQRLIERVWQSTVEGIAPRSNDMIEWIIAANLRIREVWIANIHLFNLATAVADADENFISSNQLATMACAAAGFADVPQAYYASLTFTMGSVSLRANRTVSSTYFGRDPDQVLDDARRQLDAADAPADLRGVTEARFDAGDDELFERTLRAFLTSLHQTS